MKYKVSLIIPVFNVEKYLKKCLDSALNQTLKEIEIIIVNDGSTDNSLEICNKYIVNDRVRLINQANLGLGQARNAGLLIASGEYICFLDSDDWLENETLEMSYNKAINDESDIVIFGFKRINEESGEVFATRDDLVFSNTFFSGNKIYSKIISADMKHMVCAMMVSKKLFVEHALKFPSTLHEDLYVVPQLFYFANNVSVIKKDYYNWLVRNNSITNTFGSKHIDGIVTAIYSVKIFMLRENIYQEYQVEFSEFYLTYLNMIFRRVYKFVEDLDIQNALITEIMKKSISIVDIESLDAISNEKKEKFELFFKVFTNAKNDKTSIKNDKINFLEKELYKYKNSRGYKILCKAYAIQNKLIPLGSKRRDILKVLAGKRKIRDISVIQSRPKRNFASEAKLKYDILFLPHKDYHVETMALIAEELKTEGITSCVMDLTDYYRDERSREAAKKFKNLHFKDLGLLLDDKIDYQMLVCMNDWDKNVVKPLIEKAKKEGKKTVGIIEGINDFYDADVHWERHAYQTVEYLLMTGEHDRQFFGNKKDKCFVVGIPRLERLMKEEANFPSRPVAVINLNFSYGVLEDKRDAWLESVLEGCKKADIDYIITQHPADKADLTKYNVSDKNMYDTVREGSIVISRFGSIIIEALAMGKPVIYHNPHGEKVWKFQEPMGAYSTSEDAHSLADAIKYELGLNLDYRKRANEFLVHHANINQTKSSAVLSSNTFKNILKKRVTK